MGRNIVLFILVLFTLNSCIEVQNEFSQLPPGYWRAILFLDSEVESKTEENINSIQRLRDSELPFVFELKYDEADKMQLVIHNGEERILIDDIDFGKTGNSKKDTVRINIPIYNSYILAKFQERYMSGVWVDNNRESYRIPFKAIHGQNYRFRQHEDSKAMNFDGKWKVTFDYDKDPYVAIGEFEQKGSRITGTFMTETGDYRYLEGDVEKEQMYMSCFDGSHAFLFRARMLEDGTLAGLFRSGSHYTSNWLAERDDEFTLTNPDSLTYLTDGAESLEFSFTSPSGTILSPSAPAFENKVKIVQILGTWCPNCRDETEFLTSYLKENSSPDLAVMGLAFEKKGGPKADAAIKTYIEKLNIPYEIAYAGSYRKSEAIKALPALNAVISYPTMIFMDRKNKVRHIHTGFSGPATSSFAEFQSDFHERITELLAEK